MKTVLHRAETRGHAAYDWLDTYHTFSFSNYYDPERVHFGLLRVLNDDIIQGGTGFGTHSHDNMEIVTIPLTGKLKHQDSMGTESVIADGEVQIMSAGTGVSHSEYNGSDTEPGNFLQIWIFPKLMNIAPRYDQKLFDPAHRKNRFHTIVSPDQNKEGALWINQDAWFTLLDLDKGQDMIYETHHPDCGTYIFVIVGKVEIAGEYLKRRDGMGIWDVRKFGLKAEEDSRLLLMEVPMEE